MRTIVVSCINIRLAGPLTVVREMIAAFKRSEAARSGAARIVVLCHSRALFEDLDGQQVELIEDPPGGYAGRIDREFRRFHRWSENRSIDLWLSMGDITPRVIAKRQAVYCHNPSPFYRGPSHWMTDPRFELFRRLYGILYGIGIRNNHFVIVQQQWMRDHFVKRYGLARDQVVVAHPVRRAGSDGSPQGEASPLRDDLVEIIYPVFPRHFKNHGVLVGAMKRLEDLPLRLTLTFAGDENHYARTIRTLAGNAKNIRFTGFLSRPELEAEYARAALLVFPSKLETWGLPLSEFRALDRPVLAADLPYAREPLSGYGRTVLFDPDDDVALAALLRRFVERGDLPFVTPKADVPPPAALDWDALAAMLLRSIDA